MEQKFYVFSAQSHERLRLVYQACKQDFHKHLFFRNFPSLQFALGNPFSEKAFAELLEAVGSELVEALVAVPEKGRVQQLLRFNGSELREPCQLLQLSVLLKDRRRGIPDARTLQRAFDPSIKDENFLHLSLRAREYIGESFRYRRNCAITNRLGYADLIAEIVTGYRIEELRQPSAGHSLRFHEWVLEFDKPALPAATPPAAEMAVPEVTETVTLPPACTAAPVLPMLPEATGYRRESFLRNSFFSVLSAIFSFLMLVIYGVTNVTEGTPPSADVYEHIPGRVIVLNATEEMQNDLDIDFPLPSDLLLIIKGSPVYGGAGEESVPGYEKLFLTAGIMQEDRRGNYAVLPRGLKVALRVSGTGGNFCTGINKMNNNTDNGLRHDITAAGVGFWP